MMPSAPNILVWCIVGAATAGVIARPFRWPEAVWATSGAFLVIAFGLLNVAQGWRAVGKGLDVYLFLIGMMLLSEVARREGLFDVVGAMAVNMARGSTARLFLLVYIVGIVVTTVLSNDATAVVLTPAVFAASRKAKVDALPFLFICAFAANAASFVLPISNPANLVLFAAGTPPLADWMARFALPSALSVLATYGALRWIERGRITGTCARDVARPALSAGGLTALVGIGVTAVCLLVVSSLDVKLGLPTFALGVATTLIVLIRAHASPLPVLKGVAWSVIPLVAGLFVLVDALARSGAITALAAVLARSVQASPTAAAAGSGALVAVASNLMNNLPAGLIASSTLASTHAPRVVADALLIGVDLGPNLSITGSLATILWLAAIRREGETVGFGRFLKVGAVVMPAALLPALAARILCGA